MAPSLENFAGRSLTGISPKRSPKSRAQKCKSKQAQLLTFQFLPRRSPFWESRVGDDGLGLVLALGCRVQGVGGRVSKPKCPRKFLPQIYGPLCKDSRKMPLVLECPDPLRHLPLLLFCFFDFLLADVLH